MAYHDFMMAAALQGQPSFNQSFLAGVSPPVLWAMTPILAVAIPPTNLKAKHIPSRMHSVVGLTLHELPTPPLWFLRSHHCEHTPPQLLI
jgi:hypothetical protein